MRITQTLDEAIANLERLRASMAQDRDVWQRTRAALVAGDLDVKLALLVVLEQKAATSSVAIEELDAQLEHLRAEHGIPLPEPTRGGRRFAWSVGGDAAEPAPQVSDDEARRLFAFESYDLRWTPAEQARRAFAWIGTLVEYLDTPNARRALAGDADQLARLRKSWPSIAGL